jgi:hypothetical protein
MMMSEMTSERLMQKRIQFQRGLIILQAFHSFQKVRKSVS